MQWVEGTQMVVQVLKSSCEGRLFVLLLAKHGIALRQYTLEKDVFRVPKVLNAG